jgi:hypothetical protein
MRTFIISGNMMMVINYPPTASNCIAIIIPTLINVLKFFK